MSEVQTPEDLSIQAAKIERLTDTACAKINENANRAASRVIEATDKAKASIAEIEKAIGAASKNSAAQGAKINVLTKEFQALRDKLNGISEAAEDVDSHIIKARGYMTDVCDIIGKPVCLKSGGHTMTAASLADDGGILCFWSAGPEVFQLSIPLAALEAADAYKPLSDSDVMRVINSKDRESGE